MVETIRSVLLRSAAAVAVAAGIAGYSETASACPYEAYIGSICVVTVDYCPDGYLMAQGQELPVQGNQALFALLGSRYGGDGATKFNLPDLRGRTIVGVNPTNQGGLTAYQLAQKRGVEGVTLNANQTPLPSHSHTTTATPGGGGTASGAVTLNVSSASPSVSVSGTANLPLTASIKASDVSVSGPVNLATSAPTGTASNTPASGSILRGTTSPAVTIWAPASGNTANLPVGGTQTFTGAAGSNIAVNGSAAGTVTSTGTATVSGQTATGTVSLPVTGGSGGITINPTGAVASLPTPVVDPSMALTVCIANSGIYPTRP